MADIGNRIRALRKSRGLNQTQLGALVRLDQSTISDIERGASFGADVLMALSDALETSARYIMRGGTEAELFEAELLALFRSLSDEDRTHLLRTIRALSASKPPDHPPGSRKFKVTR